MSTDHIHSTARPLKIGWATRDITPQEPVGIPGQFHLRVAMGVLDPVTLTALAIENGKDAVIFLSADLVVARNFLIDQIRARVVAADPAVPADKILLNVTHTHTGPGYYSNQDMFGTVSGEECSWPETVAVCDANDMRDFLAQQAADAVLEAWHSRAPGGVAWGYGFAVAGHSRRVIYFDDVSRRPGLGGRPGVAVNGHGVMYGNTDDDQFSHYEAGTDSFVNLLYTFDPAGKLTGALINVACPAQNNEQEWQLSASFWHEVRMALKAKYGNIHILPQSAAAGDLAPRQLHFKAAELRRYQLKYGELMTQWAEKMTFPEAWFPTPENRKTQSAVLALEMARRYDIAERIVSAFDEVLIWARRDIRLKLDIRHAVTVIQLDKRRITPEEYVRERDELAALKLEPFRTGGDAYADMIHNSVLASRINRCRMILNRYEIQDAEPRMPMELHVIQIGNIAFVSNRFELFMDYMHRIQARSPFEQTFVVQLAATPGMDGGTYLATERAAANKGYSASLYDNLISPAGGQQLVEETVRILKELF